MDVGVGTRAAGVDFRVVDDGMQRAGPGVAQRLCSQPGQGFF
jgi:hypothetical protein